MTTASRQYVSYLAGRKEENKAVGRRCCYSAPAAVTERKRRGQRVPFRLFSPQSHSRTLDTCRRTACLKNICISWQHFLNKHLSVLFKLIITHNMQVFISAKALKQENHFLYEDSLMGLSTKSTFDHRKYFIRFRDISLLAINK